VRYQAALRPDILCFLDFKPLSQFPIPSGLPKSSQNPPDRGKTVVQAFVGIRVTYLQRPITNAASESINSKIQWVKDAARFRNKTNFKTAI
jgi:hypothetical protein